MHFVPQGLQTQPYKMRIILSGFGSLTVFSHPIHPHNSPLSKGLALWGFLRLVFRFQMTRSLCVCMSPQAANAPLQQQTHSPQKGASPPHLLVQQKTPPTDRIPQAESPISPLKSDGQPRRHMSMAELSGVPQTPLPAAAAPSAKKGAPSIGTSASVVRSLAI